MNMNPNNLNPILNVERVDISTGDLLDDDFRVEPAPFPDMRKALRDFAINKLMRKDSAWGDDDVSVTIVEGGKSPLVPFTAICARVEWVDDNQYEIYRERQEAQKLEIKLMHGPLLIDEPGIREWVKYLKFHETVDRLDRTVRIVATAHGISIQFMEYDASNTDGAHIYIGMDLFHPYVYAWTNKNDEDYTHEFNFGGAYEYDHKVGVKGE